MAARARPCLAHAMILGLVTGPGCVHVYQPLSGLTRPIVVDTTAANFQDLRLSVLCAPGGLVNRAEAEVLCERVTKLFENQGATVSTSTDSPRPQELGSEFGDEWEGAPRAAPTTDLVLELRSREIHRTSDPLSWALCIGTATLVPAYTESTFAQDVVIRDATGFMLASDTLQGRIIRTFGLGAWAGNKILDLVWRKKADELSTKQVYAEVSADLYGQLSQLVFNAKMRWRVLKEATPDGRATSQPLAVPTDAPGLPGGTSP